MHFPIFPIDPLGKFWFNISVMKPSQKLETREKERPMDKKLEDRELVLYLMARFNMTEGEAERMVAEKQNQKPEQKESN